MRPDRLGRDSRHLVNLVGDLTKREVGLKVLAGEGASIDTTTANGRLVFAIFAGLADYVERVIMRSGIALPWVPCGIRGQGAPHNSGATVRGLGVTWARRRPLGGGRGRCAEQFGDERVRSLEPFCIAVLVAIPLRRLPASPLGPRAGRPPWS